MKSEASFIECTQVEEALKESQERFRIFIRQCRDGIIIIDSEGKVVEWNDGIEEITGIPRSEALGQPLWEIQYRLAPDEKKTPAYLHSAREKIFIGLKEGVDLKRILEDEIQRPDGSRRIIQSVLFAMHCGKGILAGGICRDITERRRAEQALHEAQVQLQAHADDLKKIVAQRTAKLEETIRELEHFSYALIHDLRAPLRAMQGFTDLLEEEYAGDQHPLSQQYFRHIKMASTQMDRLITDSLNYSKAIRQELITEPVDLGELLPSIVETYPNLQPHKSGIVIEALPAVLGNRAALTQCFSNLLGNAVKFAKPGAKPQIRVRAEDRPNVFRAVMEGSLPRKMASPPSAHEPPLPEAPSFNPPPPAISEAPLRHLVRIWVEDQGIGVPKDSQQRIFGMFQQATAGYEGTGVGLAIVRKLVERMGGRAGVESEEGQGSRFWVELCRAP